MFKVILIAFCAAAGASSLAIAWEDWLRNSASKYVVRGAAIGVLGLAAAVAGLVEVIA